MAQYKFNRFEFAGSLGDLGTLLPIAIGMIFINGLDPTGLFISIGLFYIFSGLYYGITVPVQPMKVIGAYAIATSMSATEITASSALMGVILLIIGASNAITLIGKYMPKSVIRGVQLATGTLLMTQGVKFMLGITRFQVIHQAVEPFLIYQHLGSIPIGVIIGIPIALLTLFFLDNKKIPAGLVVIISGFMIGLFLGTHQGFEQLALGINLPEILPFGFPSQADFTFVLFALVLPQLPMTLGNAVIANADLSKEYFGAESKKLTYRALTLTMAFANFMSFFFGGMPLCHGAGGLAAHYRFGARTAGSNIIIGIFFLTLTICLGNQALTIVNLLPLAVLGVLLIFAGCQLAMTILDMKDRQDIFVVLIMLAITITANLAYGFISGIIIAHILKYYKIKV